MYTLYYTVGIVSTVDRKRSAAETQSSWTKQNPRSDEIVGVNDTQHVRQQHEDARTVVVPCRSGPSLRRAAIS